MSPQGGPRSPRADLCSALLPGPALQNNWVDLGQDRTVSLVPFFLEGINVPW